MAIDDTADWRELLDVALFETNRVKLRQCIKHAKRVINDRLDVLMRDQSESGSTSERIALSDALNTLAQLHKIVYAGKPKASARGQEGRVAGQAGL
jgi:hypothetical protein